MTALPPAAAMARATASTSRGSPFYTARRALFTAVCGAVVAAGADSVLGDIVAPRKKRREPAIAQAAGDPALPILPTTSVIQLPNRTMPRSANLGARRRAIMVTDGAIYQRAAPWWGKKEPAVPYAYIISPTGDVEYKMEFSGRKWPALPYGIAEDPLVRCESLEQQRK